MQILQVPSPNFGYPRGTHGRAGYRIRAIVDHVAQGYASGLAAIFSNPASEVSAHYAVMRDGTVHQYVAPEDTAWGAGVLRNPDEALEWLPGYWNALGARGEWVNQLTINIEHEGFSGQPFTEEQIEASIELHRMLVQKYDIPIDSDHIVGHNRLNSVDRANDPGPTFFWAGLFAALRGDGEMKTMINSLALIWDKLSEIQQIAGPGHVITALAEEAKQQGVVEIKRAIGLQ